MVASSGLVQWDRHASFEPLRGLPVHLYYTEITEDRQECLSHFANEPLLRASLFLLHHLLLQRLYVFLRPECHPRNFPRP